jgi:hypothetical protein
VANLHILNLLLLFVCIATTTGRASSVAAGQEFPIPSQLPPRSWDSVGSMAFAHLAKREGPLNSSDAEFLARFSMVCFEKPTDQVHTGWVEDKMNAAARAVKRVRPEVWALRYINGLLDFTGAPTNFSLHYKAAALGLLWPPFHANWSTFDVTDPRMRALLVRECLNATTAGGGPFDGCFVDRANFGRQMLADYRINGRTPPRFTSQMVATLPAAQALLLYEMQAAVGPERLVLAKEHMGLAGSGDGRYVNSLMMNDGLCSQYAKITAVSGRWYDPATCLAQLNAGQAAAARGQLLQARAMGPLSGKAGDGNFTFTLATFLVIAGNASFYSYADNSNHNSYELGYTPWRPEYDRPLGLPLALAERRGANGTLFRRSFKHGVNVMVDVYRGLAVIDWGGKTQSVAGGAGAETLLQRAWDHAKRWV